MQHLQPNTTLQGGKYKIVRVLGQGGFGITYLAVQTSLSRMVAVKEFFMRDYSYRADGVSAISTPTSESALKMELYRKKFIKEAHNLARIRHPNIISVIEVFEENGTVYYSMPYMSGGSLQNYVASNGQLAENTAMHYIRQIARALKYMHEEEHICHYDVKPSNILLDDKGNAILIDFGISKNYDSSGHETSTTPIGLSEGYAPIEQYQQNVDEFSPASDVYALGATLYFLLHGRKPVSAIQRASGSSLLMSTYLSQGVKDIINASMKISKQERAQNVDVFLQVTSSPYSYAPHHHSPSFDERTYTAGSSGAYTQDLSQMNSTPSQNRPQQSKSSDGFSGLWTFLAIAGAILLGIILFAVFSSNNQAQTEQVSTNSTEEVFINPAEQLSAEKINNKETPIQEKSRFNWSGNYLAEKDAGGTYGGTPIFFQTEFSLKRINDVLYEGIMEINGYQTNYAPAKIKGYVNGNRIRIYFVSSNDDGLNKWGDICNSDTPLLSLAITNGSIESEWYATLCESEVVDQSTPVIKQK